MLIFRLFLLPIFLIIFFMASCVNRSSLLVTQILIDREFYQDFPDLSRDNLRKIAIQTLFRQQGFQLNLNQSQKGILKIRVKIFSNQDFLEKEQLAVSLKYSILVGSVAKQYFGSAVMPVLKPEPRLDVFKRVYLAALTDLLSDWQGDKEESAKLLSYLNRYLRGENVNESQLLQSIHVLGIQKEKKVVGLLIKMLSSNNEKIALTSLAALTHLADPVSLDPIIQYAERKNADIRKQAILAARQIGGKKAAAWLFTMSTGHEDPDVRLAAAKALRYVEATLGK